MTSIVKHETKPPPEKPEVNNNVYPYKNALINSTKSNELKNYSHPPGRPKQPVASQLSKRHLSELSPRCHLPANNFGRPPISSENVDTLKKNWFSKKLVPEMKNYYQIYHVTRPPQLSESRDKILIALGRNDGCYVELEVGSTPHYWTCARNKLSEEKHQWHFFAKRGLKPPNNNEDQKSYFLEGRSPNDVLGLAKHLLATEPPTWLIPRKGTNNGLLEAALCYRRLEVVGRDADGEDCYVLQICLHKSTNDPLWKIVSIFPLKEAKHRYYLLLFSPEQLSF
jgi:hypothetical protein